MGSKAVKTALNKSPNLKAKAENFAKNAFENVKQTLQNSNLDKNARTALENIFSKELIKALDSRAFVMGDDGLKNISKAVENEVKGLYNVVYNGKNATRIFKDLELVDEVILLRKGYHDNTKDKGKGVKHLKAHFEPLSEGFIEQKEYLNLGNDIRKYLKDFKEPFVDNRGARIYEWFNNKGDKFRVVIDKLDNHEAQQRLAHYPNEEIIT